jgi:hypothetical protein
MRIERAFGERISLTPSPQLFQYLAAAGAELAKPNRLPLYKEGHILKRRGTPHCVAGSQVFMPNSMKVEYY